MSEMFCYQCEQTYQGTGCTARGVCQKDPDLAALQDYLIHSIQDLCEVINISIKNGKHIPNKLQLFIFQSLFSTLTNVNFSHEDILAFIQECHRYIRSLSNPEHRGPETLEEAVAEGRKVSIPELFKQVGEIRCNIIEISIIAAKGLSAYAYQAMLVGCRTMFPVFRDLCQKLGHDLRIKDANPEYLGLIAKDMGRLNMEVMQKLHDINCQAYGHPEPGNIDWIHQTSEGSLKPGPAILCSGHDLFALDCLVLQAELHGVRVYTHGEMLPAHGYPHFKRRLAGHFGTAWQNQRKEFEDFPGPIVATTNCFVPPLASYRERVFTCPPVSANETKRVVFHDFSEVIQCALEMDGFPKRPAEQEGHKVLVGYGLHALQQSQKRLIAALDRKEISHIYVIGGCDGSESVRNQFTELAHGLPNDSLILTMGCGKFKINDRDYGTVAGIPRLLDMGQCNDSYVGILIASALAEHYKVAINELPLTFVVSWFEQKAVAILMSLFYLGVKNIYLGPRMPAFFSPRILSHIQKEHQLTLFNDAQSILQKSQQIHKTQNESQQAIPESKET